MNAQYRFPASVSAGRLLGLLALCCLVMAVSACVPKTGTKGAAEKTAVNPDERKAAYGVSLVIPSSWQVQNNMAVQAATKEALDSRRRGGERVPLLEALGPASTGVQSLITVYLVNQEPGFMIREYAERMQPHEFEAVAKDLLAQEKAESRKKKTPNYMKDMKIERQNINGNLTVMSRIFVVGPDERPVYLMYWDVYLADGAGIAVRAVCDQSSPTAESELLGIVRTLRIN